MPALKDLFKTQILKSGQTAEKENAVRDSKERPIRTNSVLINNTVLPLFNKFRLRNSEANSETFIEETLTGLRPLRLISIPFLYGTNLFRLATKSTYAKDLMIANRNGGDPVGIGAQVRTALAGAVNNVGLFPYNVYPSLLLKQKDKKGRNFESSLRSGQLMDFIYGLKAESGGVPFLGPLVAGITKNLRSSINTNQIKGQVITRSKNFITGLFLENRQLQFPEARRRLNLNRVKYNALLVEPFQYTEDSPYQKLKDLKNFNLRERNDISSFWYLYNDTTDAEKAEYKSYGLEYNELTLNYKNANKKLSKNPRLFGNFQQLELNGKSEAELAKMYSYFGEKGEGTDTFSKLKVNTDYSLDNRYGISNVSDALNNVLPSLSSVDEASTKINEIDFVTLKFKSFLLQKPITTRFRATITGLTETISPQWDTNKFIGNPFPVYLYNQVERQVQFNFKVYSLNIAEHVAVWEKINFLTSLCYPQEYSNIYSPNESTKINNYTHATPPFIQFTLGSMFVNSYAFIESLTYTVEDTYPWETNVGALIFNKDTKSWERVTNSINIKSDTFQGGATAGQPKEGNPAVKIDLENYILPQIIDVNISLKIVESVNSTIGRRMYGDKKPFTKVKDLDEVIVKADKKKNDKPAEMTPAELEARY